MPHPGHCLTRAIKDLFPRYKTMRGYRCERKAGWDTHGLPVEVEVCKDLGIHTKEEIEAYGIEEFIQKCQQSVWRYMRQWEQLTAFVPGSQDCVVVGAGRHGAVGGRSRTRLSPGGGSERVCEVSAVG
jgi:hypothetical protein